MGKKIMMILIIVLLLIVIAGAVFFFMSREKEIPFVRTEYSPGEYFVTNVKDSNRLLKATVVIVLNTDTLGDLLLERNAQIRDVIVTVFRGQDLTALTSVDLSPIKEELTRRLNEMLEIESIIGILFSDWAVQ